MITRVLGVLGIVGGLILVAGFVPALPWEYDAFNLRLVLFNLGAMAVVVGVIRHAGRRVRPWAIAIAIAALLANGWYLVMVLLSIGRPVFPAPDAEFRPIFFYAAIALWLTDAAFGFAAARLGAVHRLPALALGFGALLALTGLGGLGFTTGPLANLVGPLSLIGIALVGLGWIGMGTELVRPRADRIGQANPAGLPVV